MKLVILGGGGFRVPLIYQALLRDTTSPGVDQVALYDRSPERLKVMTAVLTRLAEGVPGAPAVSVHTEGEIETALQGADFVFSAVRVGGLEGRRLDERVALDLGVLGQETTGPGGLAYGLRTIPVMLDVAERIRTVAPNAYVINFTNPAGMITEALRTVLGDRVIGICDTPGGLVRRAAAALGLDPARVQADYIGLNHLGWLRRLVAGGHDRLPGLLANENALASLEEGEVFGTSWLRTLGCLPNEYLFYYYFNRDAVRTISAQPHTRGEFLNRQQAEFYTLAGRRPARALELWRRTIAEREALYMAEAKGGGATGPDEEESRGMTYEAEGGASEASGGAYESAGGYEAVALALMAAIARDERSTMILNVANNGTVNGLPDDAVVEVPCLVDAGGAHPLSAAPPDLHQRGLMEQVKAVDRLVIEAATTRSPDAALKAFALHPLVGSVTLARDLLTGYRSAIPELARLFAR